MVAGLLPLPRGSDSETPDLIHHSDRGVQGGFNRSLQHLDGGGGDGTTGWVVGNGYGTPVGALTGASGGGAS
jgi:hypothetical protein